MTAERTWAEVSLGRLAENYRRIEAAVGADVLIAPVVKANAYGHGAVDVSRRLAEEGARYLAVNCVNEGVVLRESGISCRILVMGGVLRFERAACAEWRLTPVVHTLEELRDLDAASLNIPVHLMIDTGITRLGAQATAEEVVNALSGLKSLRVEGLMSHFASAECFDSRQTEEQIACFDAVCQALRAARCLPPVLHFSGTSGVAYGRRSSSMSLVRTGLAVYGYIPPGTGETPPLAFTVDPVLTWRARLVGLKEVPEGTCIGYGARFRAPRPMRIGIVAAGYADGVPHRLSNGGQFVAGGRLATILGAVSMDLTTIDLSEAPSLRIGDPVTLIGREGDVSMDAQKMAHAAGEISYSVLCGIGNRVKRVYLPG